MRLVYLKRVQIKPTLADDQRTATPIRQDADSGVDLVDAVPVAPTEPCHITRVLTIDQRYFRFFRPQHGDALHASPNPQARLG